MNNITFAHPLLLLLLLVIPLMVVWYIMRYRKQKPALQFSSINLFKGVESDIQPPQNTRADQNACHQVRRNVRQVEFDKQACHQQPGKKGDRDQ